MAKVIYKFNYKKIGTAYRPIIDITLKHGGKSIKYAVLVDSGADFNIFHSDVAELLGIDLSKIKPVDFGGVKNSEPCKGYPAGIKIEVNGVVFDAAVLFSPDISNNGYAIVGQKGFFEHFVVQFDYKNKHGYLKK